MKTFYITTPLYYVNASPHIGHAYTNIITDSLNRFLKLNNIKSFFLTGTDEHGQKIFSQAQKEKTEVKEFVGRMAENFKKLWKVLNVEYDFFIRTTDGFHEETVKKVLEILMKNGDIYEGQYQGYYCVHCETFWDKKEMEEQDKPLCLECKRPVEFFEEKNYFFRLSKYQDWLKKHMESNPGCVKPRSRWNEVKGFLDNHQLQDLCISRPKERLSWGIPTPFSSDYVVYVWFDALLNYISGCGFHSDEKKFKDTWPADFHFIGKDILRHHAIIWPIMLRALGVEAPRCVFAHGWWLTKGKNLEFEKMSKSKGNVVNPFDLVEEFGADALRYFVLREAPLGQDGTFSIEAIVSRINSDLANDLGNLVYRTVNMQFKYFSPEIRIPANKKCNQVFSYFLDKKEELFNKVSKDVDFYNYLQEVWVLINKANKFVEDTKPWELKKAGKEEELAEFLYQLFQVLRMVAILIWPVMPSTSEKILEQLGMDKDRELSFQNAFAWKELKKTSIDKSSPLFPRIQS